MRDLVRIRVDFKIQETKAKQQINGFILRNGHIWPKGKSRKTKHIKSKEKNASEHVKAVAWKAQKRLCTRCQKLVQSGKNKNQIIVAIACEVNSKK